MVLRAGSINRDKSTMQIKQQQRGGWLAILAFGLASILYGAEESLQTMFEAKYQAWRQWRTANPFASIVSANAPFDNIVALGPRALPFIVQKIQHNPDDVHLEWAIRRITKMEFYLPEWPTNGRPDSHWACKMILQWWKEGRKETAGKFSAGYAQYLAVRAQGKEVEAQTEIGRIRSLGIAALPHIMEKIQTDNGDLVKLVSQLTDRAVSPDAKPADCLEWWAKNKEKWLLPDN